MKNITSDYITSEDTQLTCTWEYYPGCRGQRDSLGGKAGAGPPLEPDEPPTLELVSATDENGHAIELSPADEEKAREQAWEQMADREQDTGDEDDFRYGD